VGYIDSLVSQLIGTGYCDVTNSKIDKGVYGSLLDACILMQQL
jgi:hypothetical protein